MLTNTYLRTAMNRGVRGPGVSVNKEVEKDGDKEHTWDVTRKQKKISLSHVSSLVVVYFENLDLF